MSAIPKNFRAVLAAVTFALIVADIWWLANRKTAEQQDYQIGMTIAALAVESPETLPRFEELDGSWFFNGKQERSIANHILDTGRGPDSIGKYIVIRLKEQANTESFRHALIALTNEGICNVGVFGGSNDEMFSKGYQIRIFSVDWVRDDSGNRRVCKSRFG